MSIEAKKIQRKELIKIRNNIKNDDLTAKSLIIENTLFDIISYYAFETVFAFAPFNNEVNIFGLIKRLLKCGIKLALPRVEKNTMNFHHKFPRLMCSFTKTKSGMAADIMTGIYPSIGKDIEKS